MYGYGYNLGTIPSSVLYETFFLIISAAGIYPCGTYARCIIRVMNPMALRAGKLFSVCKALLFIWLREDICNLDLQYGRVIVRGDPEPRGYVELRPLRV